MSARGVRIAAFVAAAMFAGSTLAFGLWLPGYSQFAQPVALLGARGIAHAWLFDACAFAMPGLLGAWVCWRLRDNMPAQANASARIGAVLTTIAALAFALQGALALDPEDLEAATSRAHAAVWAAWWIAFVAGAVALAVGHDGRDGRRAWAVACALTAAAVALFAASPWPWLPAAIAQRLAYGAWFVWLLIASRRV